MKALFNPKRLASYLIFMLSLFLSVTLNGQTAPEISDIPDQSVPEGQLFADITLDDLVIDPDNNDSELLWSYENNSELVVNIEGHVARVSVADENWNGSDTITFTVTDPNDNSDSDEAIFTVAPVNDPPVAYNNNYSVNEGESLSVVSPNILDDDFDVEGSSLLASPGAVNVINGSLDLANDGSFTYVHNGSETSSDAFTYTASDGEDQSNEAAVNITINPVNDPPVANNNSYTVAEGGTLMVDSPTILSDDTDAEGDDLLALLGTGPLHDSSFDFGGDGTFTYVHDGSEISSDAFTYTATDGEDQSNEASVNITVLPVNDPPVVDDIEGEIVLEGGSFKTINLNDLVSDEEDSDNLLAWEATGNNDLTVKINKASHVADINIPDDHWNGSETITFTSTDTEDASDSDQATFTVTALAEAPVAVNDGYTVAEGATIIIDALSGVLSNDYDSDGDPITATLVAAPSYHSGTFTLNSDGSFTYIHNGGETGNDSFTYHIWDGTSWSNDATVTITVTTVNDAPVLSGIESEAISYAEGSGAVQITGTIAVADVDNANLSFASITVSSNYQSSEDVLSCVNTYGLTGVWNSGSGLYTLTGSATLSNYQSALRAMRYTNSSSNPLTSDRTITFYVNDGSASSNSQIRTIQIGASNDAPVLTDPSSTSVSFTENGGSVQLTNTIAISDADNTNLASATVTISSGLVNTEDALTFTPSGGITGSYNGTTGTLSLSNSATLLAYRTVLRSVRYNNTSEEPVTTSRIVSFIVNDGSSPSNTINKTVTITAVNDAPVLSGIESEALSYAEGAGDVQITGTIAVADVDNANLSSASITVSSNYQNGEDVLSCVNTYGLTGVWNSGSGLYTLTGSATLANYQLALRAMRYTNTSSDPLTSDRTITFYVNDGSAGSNSQIRTIHIGASNNAPVLNDPLSLPVSFTENGGSVRLTNTILVSDIDNTNLTSATIAIGLGWVSAEDVLSYTSSGGIGGSYNPATGVLSLSGSATLATYQTVLRSVRYNNTSEAPNTISRSISFTVSDGITSSNSVYKTVNITAVNDLPELSGIEGTPLSYAEGDGAKQITNTIAVADDDDLTLASATIYFTSNYQSDQDVLSCVNSYGLTGSWTPGTGQYKLTGTGTLANYQNALRAMRYTNTSDNPMALFRTITFIVFDGGDNSNIQSRVITLSISNNPPVLADPSTVIITYIEDTPAEQLTNTITVADPDNTSLVSAGIAITSGLQSAEDTLSFTSANGITGIYTPATGTLALTGTTTLINYQAALRSVKYRNTSNNPNIVNRTITFTVSDGTNQSNGINKTVTITPVNDAPVLTDPSTLPVNYTENGSAVQLTNTITITDAENTTLTSASIAIASGFKTAEDTLSFTSANGITGNYVTVSGILTLTGTTTLANYRTALRSVRYRNKSENPTVTNRIISFTVSDGNAVNPTSNIIAKTVTITAVNDPPTATNVIITASNDRIGTLNTGSFTFTDPDGDLPGTHVYKWYRSDYATGIPATVISGAITTTYRPVKADGGKYICFEVTPVDAPGSSGVAVKSAFRYINAAPVASNAHVYAPLVQPGENIMGRFTYYDKENNPRGVSIYHWYRSGTSNPTPASPGTSIGTTDSTYRIVSADAGKYIWFRVHPVAQAGSTPGDSVWSNIIGPIGKFSASIAGSDTFCYGATMPITLTITAGKAPYTAILHREGSAAKDTTITAIASSPRIIQVKITGTYTLKKLTDEGLDEADITESKPVVLVTNPKSKALLTGTAAICNDGVTRANLSLNFTSGTSPWSVTVRRRENAAFDTVFTGVTADPFYFGARVVNNAATRHRVIAITDANGCPGDTASGSAWVSYKPSPTATISGIDTICPGENATLTVAISPASTPPWSFTYLHNGTNPATVSGITGYAYTLTVTNIGTYTLSGVSDLVCAGRVSGTGYVRAYSTPTATITGTANICEHTSANLSVALTGNSPWKYSYRLNSETPIEVLNVAASPNIISVQQGGTYTLFEVYDKRCKGTVLGSAVITITQGPDVAISGLAPAYNTEFEAMVPITGTPSGGTFSGPGLFYSSPNWFFLPRYAPVGTHNIIYAYRTSPSSCYGYDTAVVRILEADAIIEFENNRVLYCRNDQPFLVTGANLLGVTGTFTISGGNGLTNLGDNMAEVDPSVLAANKYTLTYTYYDGVTPLWEVANFDVGNSPEARFNWATECFQAGQPIALTDTSYSPFGYLTDTSFVWRIFTSTGYIADSNRHIAPVFAEPGIHRIELAIQNSYGCVDTLTREFALRPTIPLADTTYSEDFESRPISWQSGIVDQENTMNSWELGNPSKHGLPLRGFSGAASGSYCWYTNIPTNTAPKEQSYITSPCFDFRGTERPMFKAKIWRLFSDTRDGANFQASTDSGKTWIPVGELNDGVQWFNAYYGIPGAQSMGWTATKDAGWIQSTRHSLDAFKNESQVQFRFAYSAIGTAIDNDGIAFDDVWILERNRTALIEHFTNSSDFDCAGADSTLDTFIQEAEQNAIDLQYHTSNPANDPFYDDNQVIPTTRQFYYGLSDVPYALLDGGSKSNHRFDYIGAKPFDPNAVIVESLQDSKFDIRTHAHVSDNYLDIETEIFSREAIPLTELSVRIAVIERVVEGITGINGDTLFRSVVKTMLPSAAGTTIYKAWGAGESSRIDESWEIKQVYDPDELRVVVFVQNESTKEIYQAAMDTIGVPTGINYPPHRRDIEKAYAVYPNPAERQAFIKFDQETTETITLQLFNNTGSLVFTAKVPEGTLIIEIPLEEFHNGLYMLRLMTSQKLLGISKVIISK